MTTRHDGRGPADLRSVKIETGWLKRTAGSALISVGDTRVLCAVSVEERVPPFLVGTGAGWVTGEYGMLPGSSDSRIPREVSKGRPSGRTMEIQRLIGRALRGVVDRTALGPRTLWVDCDVLQADGGTRTAAVTGAWVALALALDRLREAGTISRPALSGQIAAVSVGVVAGAPCVDLDYVEDSSAEVDLNVVRTADGRYVEVQGTAETTPFRRERLGELLDLADAGIDRLVAMQREAVGEAIARVTAAP